MTYDAAGNLTNDTYSGEGQRTYDAAGRMKGAWANGGWQIYTYDANGRRVKRSADGTFRELTNDERLLINKLLEEDFPGRDAIVLQIAASHVREWDDHDGSLEFSLGPCPAAQVTSRIPVEGEFEDADGVTIHVLLHVVDGRVRDLEVYKDHSSPVIKMPGADHLRIFRPQYSVPKLPTPKTQ